ncbi:peptidyl-prolyl cis-trans isomerase [bacterium]|nr:peptidyl-prolyl cis-trans isomerase [bacterium]
MLHLGHCQTQDERKGVSEAAQTDSQKSNAVILKVQDSEYRNADFEKHLQLNVGEDYQNLSSLSLSRIFNNFIEEKILLEAARSNEISLSSKEKKDHLVRLRDDFPQKDKELSLEEKQLLYEDLLTKKYTSKLVKDLQVKKEEIEEYYEQNKRKFLRPEQVEVSQILVKTEDKAIEIREQLKDSTQEEFRRLAQEISKGAEASRGGRMGMFEMGQLPFTMEKVIFSLDEKEISPVVKSIYGFHIFRLDKKYPPQLMAVDEVRSSIELTIMKRKIKQIVSRHVQKLKKEMNWDYYPEHLTFPYQRNHS